MATAASARHPETLVRGRVPLWCMMVSPQSSKVETGRRLSLFNVWMSFEEFVVDRIGL
jgi:hypothetical protein